jgi:hypothetical protein
MYIEVKERYHTQLHSKAIKDSQNYWVFGLCPSSEFFRKKIGLSGGIRWK